MNTLMISKLITKDWHLFKVYMLGYVLLGIISAGLMAVPSATIYYLGVVGLITVLIAASAHVSISTVVTEKKESQLSFIMALPIKPMDYTLSKIFGGLIIYLVSWGAIVLSTALIIYFSHMPNGMLPMLMICALEILVANTILLCASVLTASVPVTIVTMVILNISFNLFLFAVAGIENIGNYIESPVAVFNTTALNLMGAELLTIATVIAITLYIKSRKACFL